MAQGKPLQRTTRMFLTAGIVAGPLYILLAVIQIILRPQFDITRHSLSLMSNGDLGFIQILNFFTAGILTITAAIGIRRALPTGKGRVWGPILLGLYGLGLIGAGIFTADPMSGFPPGTPEGGGTITSDGIMHLVSGAVGFLGLITSCLILARRFRDQKESGWANFSLATGIIFLAAFFGIATGSQPDSPLRTSVTIAFTLAVILAWTWVTLLCIKLKRDL